MLYNQYKIWDSSKAVVYWQKLKKIWVILGWRTEFENNIGCCNSVGTTLGHVVCIIFVGEDKKILSKKIEDI